MTDLDGRLGRLYAAVGETVSREPEKLKPTVIPLGAGVRIQFDGGLSKAQLANAAMHGVFHVAHLKDHLKRWGKAHSRDPLEVEQTIDGSLALKILVDLADADKHGDARRDAGRSGLHPRLTGLTRCLQAAGGSVPPSVEFSFVGRELVASAVQGDIAAVITADVIDLEGKKIGDLQSLLSEGVAAYEKLLNLWQSQNEPA